MSGFIPLVLYYQADSLSITLFDLASKEAEAAFEISFYNNVDSIYYDLSEEYRRPSLIVLEQRGLAKDFQEEVKSIKNHPVGKHIPLILLSQHEESEKQNYPEFIGEMATFNKPQSLESMKLLIEVVNIILLQESSA